jgi:hypothetical protein
LRSHCEDSTECDHFPVLKDGKLSNRDASRALGPASSMKLLLQSSELVISSLLVIVLSPNGITDCQFAMVVQDHCPGSDFFEVVA